MKNIMKVNNLLIFVLSIGIVFPVMASNLKTCKNLTTNVDIVKQERQVGHFKTLSISGAMNAVLVQSDRELVVVEADENIADKVLTKVSDENLQVSLKPDLNSHKSIKVTIYFKKITDLNVNGAVELSAEGNLNFSDLNVKISGSSEVDLSMKADKLNIQISGASEISFKGKSPNANIEISGASAFNGVDLEIADAIVAVSGASEATINATKSLDVQVSGGSVVKYKHGPPIFKSHVTGGGSLRQL